MITGRSQGRRVTGSRIVGSFSVWRLWFQGGRETSGTVSSGLSTPEDQSTPPHNRTGRTSPRSPPPSGPISSTVEGSPRTQS